MFKRFSRLAPYIKRNRGHLAAGAVTLVLANFFDVQVLVLLGLGIDVIGWKLGPLGGLNARALMIVLGAIGLLALAGATARFWMRWLIIGVSREIEYDLRNDLFGHLQTLSTSFFHRYPTGDIMARSTNDLEAVRLLIGPAVMYLAGTAVMLPLTLYEMIKISGTLTLITWIPMTLIVPLFYIFSRRIHMSFSKVQEAFSSISSRVQEVLSGIRVIKAYAREEDQARRFDALSLNYVSENIRLTVLQSLFIPLLSFMVGLSLLALVWGGSMMIARGPASGGLTPGRMIAFFVLLMANIWPLAAVGWVFSMIERGAASMRRIDDLFEARPEVSDAAQEVFARAEMTGNLEVKNLTFNYPGANRNAVSGLNVRVPAGETLGMTGPVGCGKSTLALLLARRYNPPRGSILIDGIDLLDWPLEFYRRRLAIVDQEPFIFSETLRENAAFGLPRLDNETIERACEIAQLTRDLEDFPSGLDTMIGERGINLSGGQRQRLALARAVAMDPAILILDDALSAVDTRTEARILDGLGRFMRGRTTVLISHRISTVSLADRILYMEDGRVIEEGTHEELIARGGKYWALAHRQQIAEEIEATA